MDLFDHLNFSPSLLNSGFMIFMRPFGIQGFEAHPGGGSLPAQENLTNAELFDGKFALAGSCNGTSDMREFVSSSSCAKSTVGTNLAPLVYISLFIVLIETLALVETLGSARLFVLCNVIRLPDKWRALLRRCNAGAGGSVRGLWKWYPSHSGKASDGMTFQSDLEPRESVYLCTHF